MTNDKPRVGIAIPLINLRPKPLISLAQLLTKNTETALMSLLIVEGAYIQHNRLMLVNLARAQGCSHIFFIDHDMCYDPDVLPRLLAHDKDIVACAYNKRGYWPPQTTVCKLDENKERIAGENLPKEPFTCESLGTGLMLVKMSVFDNLPKPWFDILINPETDKIDASEDTWFCAVARSKGYEIWCDPTIPVGHLGEAMY